MTDTPSVPNIRHLRMVQAIGRLGGISCAARELNTSQPAVTQAVSNLEKELGVALFDRRATGTYPSEIGEIFLLRVDRFFDFIENATRTLRANSVTDGRRKLPPVERTITSTQVRSLIIVSEPATVEVMAKRLGVSSASFYRSVCELERAIGCPLLDHTASGLTCNKTGLYFARELRKAIREIDFARGEVLNVAGAEADTDIIIGALPMAGSYELAAAVRAFLDRRPSARVRIRTGDYHSLVDELGKCTIDLIFGLLRKPDWATDIEEEAFFRDSFCIVARPGHPLTRVQDITPADLCNYDWIVPAEGTPRRGQIERLLQGAIRKPRFGIETSSLTTLRALLCDSDLITVMTRSEVQFDASKGLLVSMPCRFLDPIPPKGITTRTGWLPTEAHRAFLQCLHETTAARSHEVNPHGRVVKLAS